MGLDITAYTKLVPQPDATLDEDGFPKGHGTVLCENSDFPSRFAGLEEKTIYAYADSFGFRAGSYGGYNQWRRQLAALAQYTPDEAWDGKADGKPFIELVNFSDCEGVIGPVVSAKLAKDFADWMDRANATGDEWFIERYLDWKKAFEMAADDGAVSFH